MPNVNRLYFGFFMCNQCVQIKVFVGQNIGPVRRAGEEKKDGF